MRFEPLKPEAGCEFREDLDELDIVDVDEPVLFKNTFPYVEVPRTTFDGKIVEMDPPDEIYITDTTFRDGQQARPPFKVEQMVEIYKMMHELGGENGIIQKTEFFLYTKRDREAVRRCLSLGYDYPKITGWIRAKLEDLKLVKEMELEETGILTSVSDYHIFFKLRSRRREIVERYLEVVRKAIDYEIVPRCHFEDITRADIYGFVIPFAKKLMELSEESGMPVLIRLCDTLGLAVPYVEAALPRSVPKLVQAMVRAGVPKDYLEWHGHNDFGKALINATTAWLYGCKYANGTLLGIGERTGNPPIELLCFEYASLMGTTNGMNLKVITKIAEYFKRELGEHISPRTPLVGDDFNVTRAGIHADGTLKHEEVYNPFDTKRLLDRPIGIAITDKSGLAGIALWINLKLGLDGKRRIDKNHPGVRKIYEWVMHQYEDGERVTQISDQEMFQLIKKYIPELAEEVEKLEREHR